MSLSVAFSQLAKQSLFHLYVLVPLCLLICFIAVPSTQNWQRWLVRFVYFVFINWLVINTGYYFHHSNIRFGDYRFMSGFFQQMQRLVPRWLPVPLPHPFVEGLDQAKYYDEIGGGDFYRSSFGKVTILGRSSTGGSFWYYYLVSLVFKTPVAFLIFFFTVLFIRVKKAARIFSTDAFFLLMPIFYYLILFSFFYKTQAGLRHIIFIYPFIFIFSAQLIEFWHTPFQQILLASFSIYALVSILVYWSNYRPYTNEFILNKTTAYEYVGSANLDYLQGDKFLTAYLKEHPDVQRAPKQPQKGTFVIALRDYMDVWNLHAYDWIQQYKPFGNIAYTYLLIRVEKF